MGTIDDVIPPLPAPSPLPQRVPEPIPWISARESPVMARCFWCEGLHAGEHPLSVCPACTPRSDGAFAGEHGLVDENPPISAAG